MERGGQRKAGRWEDAQLPGMGLRLPGKYGKRRGALERGALRWLRGSAVRVWLVQKLPETSHLVGVG